MPASGTSEPQRCGGDQALGGREKLKKNTRLDTLERLESHPRGRAWRGLGSLTVTVADVDVIDVRVSF